jgi:hypothetical protein
LLGAIMGCVTVTYGYSDGETLTDIEQLRVAVLKLQIEKATLQAQLDSCKAEVGSVYQALGTLRAEKASRELTTAETDLKAQIESGHPGFTWNPKTGAFTPKQGGS